MSINQGHDPLLRINENWTRIELHLVANIQNGYAFSSKEFSKDSGLPLIRIRDILKHETEDYYTGSYPEEFLVDKGDILIGMDGDFNASVWKGPRGLLNQRVCRILPNSENYFSKFLIICLQPYLNAINRETSAVTVKHLSSRTIQQIPIPLPPLPEQRAIVSKIEQLFSDLDNGIENFKKAQEQLKIYRQAVLKKAFEGELNKKWREEQADLPSAEELLQHVKEEQEKHYQKQLDKWEKAVKDWEDEGNEGKKPTKPKKPKELPLLTEDELMELSELPERWGYIKFGHIYSYSPQNGLYKPSDLYGSGTSIIRIDDFYDGKLIRYKNFKLVQLTKGEVEKYSLSKGQILVNRVNSIDYLGKCGLVEKIENNVVFESNIMKISILEKIVNPKFITYFLSSYLGTKEIRKNAKHAVNQASINQNDVSITNIPFCNIQEQHQIIKIIEARLSVCDNIEGNIEKSLQKAEALRQSILKKAFEGKLLNEKELEEARNALDWEPAEKLLERIKAEKTNTKAKNKGKK